MAQQACVTLYNTMKDTKKLIDSFIEHFQSISIDVSSMEDGIKIQLFDESSIEVHLLHDPQNVKEQIKGMQQYFSQAPCEQKEVLQQVLLQISLFNCITGITFILDEQEERTNAIIGRIYAIAKDCSCILLYPDMSLYLSDGTLLLSIDGRSEVTEYRPIVCADAIMDQPNFQEEDHKRYEHIAAKLKEQGLPCVSYMISTQLSKDMIQVPEIETIVKRAIAIFACSVCAEGALMEGGSRELGLQEFYAIDKQFHCMEYLSEAERTWLLSKDVDESSCIQFSWRYECCAVLLWALGLYELNDYDTICDVATMSNIIRSFSSLDEMIQASHRKSDKELLDMHTKVLYYHWSCVEASIHQQEIKGIEPGVIQEHHYALNWLCGANQTQDWDAIQTNT